MTHKIIKLLTLISALYTHTAKAHEIPEVKPGLTILAASEQEALRKNHAEVTLKPDITWEEGEYKVGYYGSFYRSKDSDGNKIDWMTIASEIRAETDTWALDLGRSNTRQYAGYLYTPTTTSFDNQGMVKGTSRTYTGIILTHKATGFSIGQVARDTRMTPTHWNSTLAGWEKELNKEWALHLQATSTGKGISTLGVTLKWQATDATTVVAEGFYLNYEKTGLLTLNHKVTDCLTLFAGAQLTNSHLGKNGLITAGACYNLGKGFQLVGALQQKTGTDREDVILLGIKYAGDFRQR